MATTAACVMRLEGVATRPAGAAARTPRLSSGAVRTVVLTVSTSVSRREAEDASGPLLAQLAEEAGAEIVAMEVVPDDFALIEDRLHHYVDAGRDASSSPPAAPA